MKKYKIAAAVGIVAILCFALIGCFAPTVPVIDPDDPIDPPLTIPVAAFSYYSDEYPVQTGSLVFFDGSASYDPDGEIMWGRWDFDDGTVVEGIWTVTDWVWENGEWAWVEIPVTQMVVRTYVELGKYDVKLTVWDYDENQSTVTRRVRVW